MSRETANEKAARLLVTGRVEVRHVSDDRIAANVQGDHGDYSTGLHAGGWYCTCQFPWPRCSHLKALKLVTVRTVEAVPA